MLQTATAINMSGLSSFQRPPECVTKFHVSFPVAKQEIAPVPVTTSRFANVNDSHRSRVAVTGPQQILKEVGFTMVVANDDITRPETGICEDSMRLNPLNYENFVRFFAISEHLGSTFKSEFSLKLRPHEFMQIRRIDLIEARKTQNYRENN
jgi:hypothetical protein